MQINASNQELFYPDIEVHKEDKEERRKTATKLGLLSVSFSGLQRRKCPVFATAEALQIQGLRPPAPELEIGKTYHEKIQKYLLTRDETVLEGLTKETIAGAKRRIPEILALGPKVSVEKEVAYINKKGGYVLHAFLDILVENPDNKTASIIDIKTFSASPSIRPKEEEQLETYAALFSVSNKEVEQIATYIYRAKKGKILLDKIYTREEAERILKEMLIPEAEAYIKDLKKWIKAYKAGKQLEAKPGKHCHICPHIFTCPLIQKIPTTLEEAAKRYIVEREIVETLKNRIGISTIELEDVLIAPVTHKWVNIKNEGISLVLKLLNEIPDAVKREMLLGEFSAVLSPISSRKIPKAEAVIEKILDAVAEYRKVSKQKLGVTPDVLYGEDSRTNKAEIIEKTEEDLDEIL